MKAKKNILHECYEKAKEVLKECSTPYGFFASSGNKGYTAVWARDSVVSSLGASLVDDGKYKDLFKETFKASLITLAEGQGKTGQIPNCVDRFSDRAPHTDYKTIDSSLWYILGHFIYKERYKEDKLFNELYHTIEKAMNWLLCQDLGEVGMLAQLPTSDWQDAFPHKYGYTINTQALFFKVLNLLNRTDEAKKLKFMVNDNNDDNLWNGNFYMPYRWKNHGKYKEMGDWFDSLGNMLSIVFDLATIERADQVLSYVKTKRIAEPYPMKTIYPPITQKSKFWQDYFLDCAAGKPHNYANGGIWGYIGCFYVLSLIKLKKFDEAEKALHKIAEINLKGKFPEWIHPVTKGVNGIGQAWEAGMYILAYKSLEEKRVLV